MALEPAVQPPKRHQLLPRKVAGLRHHGIERRDRMSLRENEAIALWPIRPLGIVPHPRKVEAGEDVDRGERAAWVTRARFRQHLDDVDSQARRDLLKACYLRGPRDRLGDRHAEELLARLKGIATPLAKCQVRFKRRDERRSY